MKTLGLTGVALVTVLFSGLPHAEALTIIRDSLGGTLPPDTIGAGNLEEIFNAAADQWERVILDPHVLTLHFGWAAVGGGTHYLNAQGGTPNRETEGTILFNNDGVQGHFKWYLDPSPRSNDDYLTFGEFSQDFGGGAVNVGRIYSDPIGDAADQAHIDLFSAALHEIGHALGISMANTSFVDESVDGDIDVVAPLPFEGTAIPLAFNDSGVTSHIDPNVFGKPVMTNQTAGERNIVTTLDILVMAQLSGFHNLNFDPGQAVVRVALTGGGNGTVTTTPAGIDCGTICRASFSSGTRVTLTATPADGFVFAGWSGDSDCSDGVVATNTPKTCTATFDVGVDTFVLTVRKDGAGNGTVTSSSGGILCGADCSEPYRSGTVLSLDAIPGGDSVFTGWTGACSGSDLCAITMDGAQTVTATFSLVGPNGSGPPMLSGDADRSGRVDGFDLGRIGLAFGSRAGAPNWDRDADLNDDGVVDGLDVDVLGANFGRSN